MVCGVMIQGFTHSLVIYVRFECNDACGVALAESRLTVLGRTCDVNRSAPLHVIDRDSEVIVARNITTVKCNVCTAEHPKLDCKV